VLDRLSGLWPRQRLTLPLQRKIASTVGIAEIVLLEQIDETWMPMTVGDMSLEATARADAWLAVPAASEGFAAGTPVDAYMLRE
jgi:molybdopterin biosynthesis enzyme